MAAPLGISDQRVWYVYARKSRIGNGAHITKENQWGACTSYIHATDPRGADTPIRYFWDNASGWDEKAKRDDWTTMQRGIAKGEACGVVAWHVDRYTRDMEVGAKFWKVCKKARTQLHTRLGGHISSALAYNVQMAVAADESEIKSERQKLKQAELATKGMVSGGGRCYGYNAKRTAVVPHEAANVEWVADQILKGRSLKGITAELNAPLPARLVDGKPYGRGALTVQGKLWRSANLGTFMRRATIAAQRTHHGELTQATWPEIISLGKWQAVQQILNKPERRISKRAPRVYLLSGIARCAVCDGAMRGRSNASQGKGAAYFCAQGTGHAYRRADRVDMQVRAAVVARLAETDASGALRVTVDDSRAGAIQAAIRELEARQEALMPLFLSGAIKQHQLTAGTQEAEQQLAELRSELAQLEVDARRPIAVLEDAQAETAGLSLTAAAKVFDSWDLERRRAVTAELVTVKIQPQGKGGHRYWPGLVEIEPVRR